MAEPRPRPLRGLAAAGLAAAVIALAIRPSLSPPSLDPAIEAAWFERIDGGDVGLVLGPPRHDMMPSPDITAGALHVPPGWTVAVAVPPTGELVLRGPARRAPWHAVAGAPETAPDGGRVVVVADRLVSEAAGGGRSQRWAPDRPWSEDRAWLTELEQTCGGASEGARVARSGDGIGLRFGTCSAALPGGAEPLLIVAGGPDWAVIERAEAPFRRRAALFAPSVVGAVVAGLVAAGLLAVGVAPEAALATGVTLLVLSLFSGLLAGLGWLCAAVVGVASCLGRLVAAAHRRFGARGAAGTVAAVLAVAIAPTLFGPSSGHEPDAPLAGCVLTGYSTAEGDGLREGVPMPSDRLAGCSVCGGGAASVARAGAVFTLVRDQLCASEEPAPGTTVVFLGGGNDDLLWQVAAGGSPGMIRQAFTALLFGSGQLSTSEQVDRFYAEAEASARGSFEQQGEVIGEALACARERGVRFVYVHDFLVQDLDSGRSDARDEMLDGRRSIADREGAGFVDLYGELGATAGVSFFSDYIHFSAVGHDAVQETICRAVQEP